MKPPNKQHNPPENEHYYGKDCPVGQVQIEFVGVSPALRYSEYGWKPSDSAFIEIWVDGIRFRLDIGDLPQADGSKKRGIHINGPLDMEITKQAMNAVDIAIPEFKVEKIPDYRTP